MVVSVRYIDNFVATSAVLQQVGMNISMYSLKHVY